MTAILMEHQNVDQIVLETHKGGIVQGVPLNLLQFVTLFVVTDMLLNQKNLVMTATKITTMVVLRHASLKLTTIALEELNIKKILVKNTFKLKFFKFLPQTTLQFR